MSPDFRILILGGSVRAAAESARRAGMTPICADTFADLDLQAAAERVLPVENLEEDLVRAARDVPPCPWMYTGAFENRPKIVAAISATRPLWGNGPAVLAVVRDPFRLKRILDAASLPALGLREDDAPPPHDDRHEWVWKPHDGAAGRGIRRLSDKHPPEEHLHEPGYFQEFATGTPVSSVHVAGREGTLFVGTSRQLVGVAALGASRYGYCGSLGPLELSAEMTDTIRRIGEAIAADCGLRGVFGCDFIVTKGRPLLVEVNPRYPASFEIFERARGVALLPAHRAAFEKHQAHGQRPVGYPAAPSGRIVAKAILYAPRAIDVPDLSRFPMASSVWDLPFVADRPAAGTHVAKGHPVCTIMADGTGERECAERLAERVAAVREHVFGDAFRGADDSETIPPFDPLILLDRSEISR